MKTGLSEYDVNKLRTAAKEINDILYDIPEGNYDLSDKVDHVESWEDPYDDTTAHPVFGHDLPWQRTETVNIDDGTQMQMRFGNPDAPFEGKVESYHNDAINESILHELEYYKVVYSENDLKMVKAVLMNELEILASKIENHDTGHLYTTINTLQHRLTEINQELSNNLSDKLKSSLKVETNERNRVPSDWTPPYSTYGEEGC